ncbi:hypothetical protein GUJ93_ZPchr0009g2351 [Zizania palustris]|uniref:Uncharacterized protein n=1 Tax=Zizania palustris TaxID=103762 RepID=A0A8J5RHY1_ZIZPA|nr:hypothetical protein GUJ93_ZPchr0009g2351 [Zizania palustris]
MEPKPPASRPNSPRPPPASQFWSQVAKEAAFGVRVIALQSLHPKDRQQGALLWTDKAGVTMKGSTLLGLRCQRHQIQATATLFLEMRMKLENPHWFLLIYIIHY